MTNRITEGNWSVSFLERDDDPLLENTVPRLWHYCPKTKTVHAWSSSYYHSDPKKALCVACKDEPSERLITTLLLMK